MDAWGRIRRSIAAAHEEVQATAADLETIRLSLHAEMAIDYFELRSLDAQKQLLDRTLVAYQRALDLTQRQFAGDWRRAPKWRRRGLNWRPRARRTWKWGWRGRSLSTPSRYWRDARRNRCRFRFRALAGPPPVIPTGVPSQLLERRPDIAAAERRMAEANEQIGIAQAAFFPALLLTATGGLQGDSIVNWFTWPSRFWALGPSALQTLYDAGRRRAAQEAAGAGYDLTVADYREAALEAFQQVEDSLSTLRTLEREVDAQQVAVQAAERSLELAMQRYTGGLVTYLEVVSAQSIALANERIAVDLLRRRMDATVLLIKALGGGWDVSKLPT